MDSARLYCSKSSRALPSAWFHWAELTAAHLSAKTWISQQRGRHPEPDELHLKLRAVLTASQHLLFMRISFTQVKNHTFILKDDSYVPSSSLAAKVTGAELALKAKAASPLPKREILKAKELQFIKNFPKREKEKSRRSGFRCLY